MGPVHILLPNFIVLPHCTPPVLHKLRCTALWCHKVKCGDAAVTCGNMRVRIARARVAPGSPGNDLNPVIRTDCKCSVKCAEAAWNYKSGRHSAL